MPGGLPNAAAPVVARLHVLDREYRAGLTHCERHEIVTSHEAFAYLGERYGLQQVAVPIAHCVRVHEVRDGLGLHAEPREDVHEVA